jgi:putative copper export protein
MKRLADGLALVIAALWVGAMWAVGYLVVPVLFDQLADRMLAGRIAGRLFEWMDLFSIGAALCLLPMLAWRMSSSPLRRRACGLVLAMLVLAVLARFWIQPEMTALKAAAWPEDVMNSALRGSFVAWHGVSSVLHLVRSLLGVVLLLMLQRDARQAD